MKKREKAAAAAVTVAAAAGMVTGALFDSPADLLVQPDAVTAAVQAVGEDDDTGAPMEKQRGIAARLRAWVLRLPAAVRMLVGVPLWCAGWVLLNAFSVFSGGTGLGRIVHWLCLTLVLLAVFAISVKAAFPSLPFRRILRRRNLLLLLLATIVLALADLALPAVWQGYDAVAKTVWRAGAACILVFLCCGVLGRYSRVRQEAAARPAVMTEAQIRETARRLADSVAPREW